MKDYICILLYGYLFKIMVNYKGVGFLEVRNIRRFSIEMTIYLRVQ